jgi:hypothetical protein
MHGLQAIMAGAHFAITKGCTLRAAFCYREINVGAGGSDLNLALHAWCQPTVSAAVSKPVK